MKWTKETINYDIKYRREQTNNDYIHDLTEAQIEEFKIEFLGNTSDLIKAELENLESAEYIDKFIEYNVAVFENEKLTNFFEYLKEDEVNLIKGHVDKLYPEPYYNTHFRSNLIRAMFSHYTSYLIFQEIENSLEFLYEELFNS